MMEVEMEMALEVEDDVFFADLSKQISLLIMDDGDDEQFPAVQCPSVSFQAFSHPPQPVLPPPFMYGQAYRREIKGTGVFIPRSSLPRKKNRSGRSRPPDKSRGSATSCATTATNSHPSFINGHRSYSSVLKRQS